MAGSLNMKLGIIDCTIGKASAVAKLLLCHHLSLY